MCSNIIKCLYRRRGRSSNMPKLIKEEHIINNLTNDDIMKITKDLRNISKTIRKDDILIYRKLIARQLEISTYCPYESNALHLRLDEVKVGKGVVSTYDLLKFVVQLIIDRYMYSPSYLDFLSRMPDIYYMLATNMSCLITIIELTIFIYLCTVSDFDKITPSGVLKILEAEMIKYDAQYNLEEQCGKVDNLLSNQTNVVNVGKISIYDSTRGITTVDSDKFKTLDQQYVNSDIRLTCSTLSLININTNTLTETLMQLLEYRRKRLRGSDSSSNWVSIMLGSDLITIKQKKYKFMTMESCHNVNVAIYRQNYIMKDEDEEKIHALQTYPGDNEIVMVLQMNYILTRWELSKKNIDKTGLSYLPDGLLGNEQLQVYKELTILAMAGYCIHTRGTTVQMYTRIEPQTLHIFELQNIGKVWRCINTDSIDGTVARSWMGNCLIVGSRKFDIIEIMCAEWVANQTIDIKDVCTSITNVDAAIAYELMQLYRSKLLYMDDIMDAIKEKIPGVIVNNLCAFQVILASTRSYYAGKTVGNLFDKNVTIEINTDATKTEQYSRVIFKFKSKRNWIHDIRLYKNGI